MNCTHCSEKLDSVVVFVTPGWAAIHLEDQKIPMGPLLCNPEDPVDWDHSCGVSCPHCDFEATDLKDLTARPAVGAWYNAEDYPPEDWINEVSAGDTRLGYLEWLQKQRATT